MYISQSPLDFTAGLSRRVLTLMGALMLLALLAQLAPRPGAPPGPALHTPLGGAQPLAFVENRGQAVPEVRMQALGVGGTISFLPRAVALDLPSAGAAGTADLRVQFEGAGAPEIIGGEPLPERVNLLLGRDPADWHVGLPTYAALVYQGLYPGIDLRYDGRQGRLKGTYIVAPGVDPAPIRWRYQGATDVRIDGATGALLITLPDGRVLTEEAPIAWQNLPTGRRAPVEARFTIDGGLAGFALGSYNPALPLVIDPTLVYSSFLGGGDLDYGADIAVDGQGNVYVIGDTFSLNFPVTNPLLEPGQRGTDLFVTKLSPSGQRLFSTYLGGTGNDYGHAVALDGEGDVYITGSTTSTDFPTAGPLQDEVRGNSDAFVTVLRAADNSIAFSTYLGGSGDENGLRITGVAPGGIAVDAQGVITVVGLTSSDDLPTVSAVQPAFGGKLDAFVARLALAPARLIYATYLGGADDDFATDVALDDAGNAYVTGTTMSTDFPVLRALQPQNASAGNPDAFLTKLRLSDGAFVYSTYLGGDGAEEGSSVAVDGDGGAYLTGTTFNSTNFPLAGDIRGLTNQGDAYLTKVGPSGQQLVYSARFGGSGRAASYDLALGPDRSVYLTGSTDSTDFPVVNALRATLSGPSDAFVMRVDSQGCRLMASTYFGGSSFDNSESSVGALAVDKEGVVYITGSTASADLPQVGAQQPSYAGKTDAFVAKLVLDGPTDCGDHKLFLPLIHR